MHPVRYARPTLVSQFFPPDFAATGQLLDDLTQRFAARGLQVQVLTGMPAYAYNRSEAERLEFQPNRCIRRSRVSRFWPQRIRGRAINGILFCLRITVRLLRYSRRGDLIFYTTEPLGVRRCPAADRALRTDGRARAGPCTIGCRQAHGDPQLGRSRPDSSPPQERQLVRPEASAQRTLHRALFR